SLGVAVLEAHVFPLDIPEIIESLSKRIDGRPRLDRQDTDRDYFPSRLLRTCGERPSSRAADQSDELAARINNHVDFILQGRPKIGGQFTRSPDRRRQAGPSGSRGREPPPV